MHLAVLKDHPDVIHALIDRGMELDTTDREGKSPIHYASIYGNISSLKTLIKHDVDISIGEFYCKR